MLVKEACTRAVQTCRPEDNLATVGALLWLKDCGALPVISADGRVAGMITDRDIAIALATRNRVASELHVHEVMSREVQSCGPDDDVRDALNVMWTRQIRRLPVVDGQGRLQGLLSLTDAVQKIHEGKARGLTWGDVAGTLQAITAPRKAVAPRAEALLTSR